ncbi:MAG: hypothetical protein U0Q14_01425 [Dermatophilaceae bacterium]
MGAPKTMPGLMVVSCISGCCATNSHAARSASVFDASYAVVDGPSGSVQCSRVGWVIGGFAESL